MGRLIDAEDFESFLRALESAGAGDYSTDGIIIMLEKQPTIEAEPVVHGEWEHLGGDEWCCTVCENVITTEGSWEKPTQKFCDECGARMDGGDQHE